MCPIPAGSATDRVLKAVLENYQLSKAGAFYISRDSICLAQELDRE